ncbi:hypothetical protein V8G54_030150 [Vigna mungo]|uniref:Uncharacterized protein n=1 Tax=Vigna mungo TaxID=3915 RepID=A0AAQ3MW47_VIGMU
MTDHNTRYKSITNLEEAILKLTIAQNEITTRLDSITSQLITRDPPSPHSDNRCSPHNGPHSFTPHLKLEIQWAGYKISQFFEYHRTPEDDRLQIASFYMDGPALSWFQWMHRNNMLPSWHEFLQALEDRVAKFLNLTAQPTNTLRVMVGNGTELERQSIRPAVNLMIRGHKFVVDLYVLPISGADVVLGIQWLKELGPIITDYSQLTMKFMKDGKFVEFKADAPPKPSDISTHQVKRLLQTHGAVGFFHIRILPTPPSPTPSNIHAIPAHPLPQISSLLHRYYKLFQKSPSIPPSRYTDKKISLLPNSAPMTVRPYRYPHFQKAEIEKQVEEMLIDGLIQPSQSPFSSPVLLMKKKDGSWRFCVDYRALNAITTKDKFPIPTIDELLDELGAASWFSKLDLRQSYHQICMNAADIPKTAFRTHHGHYEYTVMPFRLCNAPSTFQAKMNELLKPFMRKFVIIFFDDILVYSCSLEEHLHHLEQTFQQLMQGEFFLRGFKCLFAQQKLEYLGHVVSSEGVAPEHSKIQAMVDWPPPTTIKALRIKGYATIAFPLTALLKKDAFVWSLEAQTTFNSLKKAMTEAPVLALPNFALPFVLETDALGVAMGAVLMQEGHPIAFHSKPFCSRLMHSSTYVRELHAITSVVKKWRQYLLGHSFTILTGHRSLKELMSRIIQTLEQHYKAGKTNVVADALSRPQEFGDSQLLILSMPRFLFLEELHKALHTSSEFSQLFMAVQNDPDAYENYSIHQDLLLYKGKLWLNRIAKTVSQLQQNFYWQGMRLLQPLSIPLEPWVDLSLDFIMGLPLFQGDVVILVVVDRFSKGAHFGLLPTQFMSFKVAQLFLDIVCKHHGFPYSLVSDRDPVFISKFWRELFRLCGAKLRMSTSFHPETDGQTKVLNRTLEQYLCSMVHNKPTDWGKYLGVAEWCYNSTVHSATRMSPFQITYGKELPSIPNYLAGTSSVEAVDSLLTTRKEMLATLRKKLQKVQVQMKIVADSKRRLVEYQVDDWVYVRLRPYRQNSVRGVAYQKLGKRFYDPFRILERIGLVAYRLELPSTSKIHPVFHCSVLKAHHGPLPTQQGDLPVAT